ncbi:MAG: dicarboxylate/amino acid:cation symporter [Myxococcota bacterium]
MFQLILGLSILAGAGLGYFGGDAATYIKPLGDIFLNLVLTIVVPLIFFSISAATSRAAQVGRIGKIFGTMVVVFTVGSLVAATLGLIIVQIFPPALGVHLSLPAAESVAAPHLSEQLVAMLTVSNFSELWSHKNMLALMLFAILFGVASASSRVLSSFLEAGEEVMMRMFSYVMYYAPIGFFAYFAHLVMTLGPQVAVNYGRVTIIYYLFAAAYFVVVYSAYAYLTSSALGLRIFWANIFLPASTSLATCSSAASIPANLKAAGAMGVEPEIYETTLPLGSLLHKHGSVMGGVFKIAFLFGVYQMDFSGLSIWLTAIGIAFLVGTVMGAIPSGGMLGELLIISAYGFPPEALMIIAAISIIIDPMATLLNVTGNTAATYLIGRLAR